MTDLDLRAPFAGDFFDRLERELQRLCARADGVRADIRGNERGMCARGCEMDEERWCASGYETDERGWVR
eukprot:1031956-Rhodomonas_salina.1